MPSPDPAWSIRRLLATLSLFGSGAGAVLAWQHGFYAAMILAAATAACVAAGVLGSAKRAVPPVPELPGRQATTEAALVGLRVLLDQVPVPLLLHTVDGVLRTQNRAARTLFATDDRVLAPVEPLRTGLDRLAPGEGAIISIEPRLDGVARSFALTVAQVHTHGGSGRLAVLVDIEAELQAAKATALQSLLQVLGHEIMNSLTPITSLADTARILVADGDSAGMLGAAEALETIARRAAGLHRFVDGYRLMARLPAPVKRSCSLSMLLIEARTLFENTATAVIAVAPPVPDLIIRLDHDLTMQALLNLLGNAADAFGGAPGRILLSAELVSGRPTISVTDDGPGIPEEQVNVIFQPFFTTKQKGTGIGLALARQIMQGHGGSLSLLRQTPGGGATFRMTF